MESLNRDVSYLFCAIYEYLRVQKKECERPPKACQSRTRPGEGMGTKAFTTVGPIREAIARTATNCVSGPYPNHNHII